jgi:hypothetical protein
MSFAKGLVPMMFDEGEEKVLATAAV